MSLIGIKNNSGFLAKSCVPLAFAERQTTQELAVFHHHIYEYDKGLRNLVLTTERSHNREKIEKRLKQADISYIIHAISDDKINVFFGNQLCIDVVASFDTRLNRLSPEQDFMLGIMLGYDRLKQCERYIKMREKASQLDDLIG